MAKREKYSAVDLEQILEYAKNSHKEECKAPADLSGLCASIFGVASEIARDMQKPKLATLLNHVESYLNSVNRVEPVDRVEPVTEISYSKNKPN